MDDSPTLNNSFRPVPRTGVIYVTTEARQKGFHSHHPDWCNLGQGQPETGDLEGAPARIRDLEIDPADNEYAPVAGLWELREAVANLYNQRYRQGLKSQYSAENVSICSGGRLALTRVVSALGHINVGHFLPDYTAYEELLDIFRSFTSIPILLEPDRGYTFPVEDLRREILGRGLGGLLISNPCNPTGKLLHGDTLGAWVQTARNLDCSILFDEFYSNYVWVNDNEPTPISAAAHIEDVNRDPIVILDGFTKNWRYPGWRLGWVIAPAPIISAVSSAGSFLDGGGSRPLQRAAIPLLEPDHVAQETTAIFNNFKRKREVLIDGLRNLGITIDCEPGGTFYVWGNLSNLPEGFTSGMQFFRQALERQVIVVPGEFFDVNPGKRRPGRTSRFRSYARFSFGPSLTTVEEALQRLGAMLQQGG